MKFTVEASEQEDLAAAASGSTDLPLSDRDAGWDSGAARKSLDPADFGKAFFWKDSSKPADQVTSYRLPFASKGGGSLTAVWKGVTAAAGAIQGSRGGVSIPSDDVGDVKSRISGYYAKAREEYKDPEIQEPWKSDGDALEPEEMARRLAYAESIVEGVDYDVRLEFWTAWFNKDMDLLAEWVTSGDRQLMEDALVLLGDTLSTEDVEEVEAGPLEEAAAFVRIRPEDFQNGWGNAASSNGTSQYFVFPGVTTFTAATAQEFAPAYDPDGDDDMPMLPEHMPQERMPKKNRSPKAPPSAVSTVKGTPWQATLAPEGKATDDGRVFAPESISWRELPLTLMAMTETAEGHDGAQVAGRIDRIWRENGLIKAEGVFDEGDYGQEIARMVGDGVLTGNSVDIAVRKMEIGSRDAYVDEDGNWKEGAGESEDDGEVDLVDLLFGGGDLIFVVTDGVIGMSTVCPFPAFEDASITLTASGEEVPWGVDSEDPMQWTVRLNMHFSLKRETLTASAAGLAPVTPPYEWFENPELDELTALTVTDEGRIYGHAWAWDTCHIGLQDACTMAPRSNTDYAYYLLKEVYTDGGDRVEVGTVTLDTGHASQHLGWREAAAHYDNTGTAVADVVVGEDEFGGWVSGAIRPDADAETVRKLRGASLSGDWRRMRGNLELVGLLAVNVPGFPVPRKKAALVASAEDGVEVVSLVAAGVHDGRTREDLTSEQRSMLAAMAARAQGGLEALARLAAG